MLDLNEIINQPKNLLIENYFELQKAAEAKYGKNTAIFIEVGSFYEIYEAEGIGKAQEISKILNILLTRKNKSIPDITIKNPSLCGIPSVSLEKHLERIISENIWTIILVKQISTPPNVQRKIERIISPGTNVDFIQQDNYNFIGSIYAEKTNKDIIYAGLSLIDLTTGKTLVYENFGNSDDKTLVIDEIYSIIHSYGCSEVVISGESLDTNEKEKILSDLNLKEISFTVKSDKEIKKSININYQNELLTSIFGSNTFLSAIEELDLERYPQALNSLSILLDFIIDHDKKTVAKLLKPEIINTKQKLYLGNNALSQLDISTDNGLHKVVNKCITAIGRRYTNEQLFNPICDTNEIQKRYYLSSLFIDNPIKTEIQTVLRDFYDIERIWRKFEIGTISPFEVFNLYISLKKILEINNKITSNERTKEDLLLGKDSISKIEDILQTIDDSFNIELMSVFSMANINKNFIKASISKEIASYEEALSDSYKTIMGPVIALEKIFEGTSIEESIKYINEYHSLESPRDYKGNNITIGFNDTEGFYIEITNKRYETKKQEIESFFSSYFEGKYTSKNLKSSMKFYFKELESLSDNIVLQETKLINACKKVFTEICNEISKEKATVNDVVLYVSHIDFYINNANLAEKFAYVMPEIVHSKDSFVEAIELRHAIIERINVNELFVPNDVFLGKKEMISDIEKTDVIFQDGKEYVNGMLLYGLNSSGKSTLSKSLGISIILAQAGFFVPAKKFRFSLFESLFTRITGNDNIHKGLSTFAIEMIELKNIFNRANGRTIVLGDEISHGTESISGLSIVASAVHHLNKRNALFIFATHLHGLRDVEEVSVINSVVDVHLSVHYDENKDTLIYNRKLAAGSGSSIYGLEFAKYLKLNKEFLATAYDIRKRLASDLDSIESLSRGKNSSYNSSVFLKECEICGKQGEEIHHINEQHMADDKGVIEHFHKNHKANLVCLCGECHDKVHSGEILIEGWKMTGDGKKLIFR